MTFPARLTSFLEKATKRPFVITPGWIVGKNNHPIANFNFSGSNEVDKKLIAYLVNHAEAIRDLAVAAEKAQEAMMVWTNTYAPEMCDPEGVKKSQELLNEGGTLYYIATVSQSLSEALAKLEE